MERSLMSRVIALTAFVAFVVGSISGAFGSYFLGPILHIPSWSSSPASVASSTVSTLAEEESQTVKAVKRASPAVVAINISKAVSARQPQNLNQFFNDPFFPFSDPAPQEPSSKTPSTAPKEMKRIGGGSGFFVSADGLIVTNKHVVEDPKAEYTVLTQDGKQLPAKVVAIDPVLDLAIIKVEGKDFAFLELGDSDKLEVGQTVMAIGYALAKFQNSVTKGIISGINRRIVAGGNSGSEVIEEALQTDAAISPGNSGGPLIDLNGNVLGMNTAVSQNGQSLGFALPVNVIKRSIESVKKVGRIVRPWIGVRYIQIDEDFAKAKTLPYTYGALILRGDVRTDLAIIPSSPADKAGLLENDIILELNGQKLDPEHSLSSLLSRFAPGDTIALKISSKGKEKEVSVKLEERKP